MPNPAWHPPIEVVAGDTVDDPRDLGYTILLGGSTTHITEAILKGRPLYDPLKDLEGTSKNSPRQSRTTKLPSNDSALFPFRFLDVHCRRVRNWH